MKIIFFKALKITDVPSAEAELQYRIENFECKLSWLGKNESGYRVIWKWFEVCCILCKSSFVFVVYNSDFCT